MGSSSSWNLENVVYLKGPETTEQGMKLPTANLKEWRDLGVISTLSLSLFHHNLIHSETRDLT